MQHIIGSLYRFGTDCRVGDAPAYKLEFFGISPGGFDGLIEIVLKTGYKVIEPHNALAD